MRAAPTRRRKSENLREIFAKNVLLHRTRLGLTQDELADKCDYHRTYIGSVERAERNITLATIEAFANAFSVEPYSLLLASAIAESIDRVELKKGGIRLHLKLKSDEEAPVSICTDSPLEMKRRGVEMRMVVGDYKGKPDPSLLKAIARAHLWFDELATGKVVSIARIARRENIDKGYVGRLLKLAFVPPSHVEAIVAGAQPGEWTVNILTKMQEK